jgi:capsular polysaccharide transport system permease protein
MTTTPRARKFRIRPSGGTIRARSGEALAGQGTPDAGPLAEARDTGVPRRASGSVESSPTPGPGATDDGFGPAPFPGSAAHDRMEAARKAEPAEPQADDATTPSAEAELAAIRAEGLTGRQLRMARRLAQKEGLEAASDHDAVRLLRQRGIDPVARVGKPQLVLGDVEGEADGPHRTAPGPAPAARAAPVTPATDDAPEPPAQLPAKARRTEPAVQPRPATPAPAAAEARAAEIMQVQRDIARRRRRKLLLLATRLAFFVLLPTLLVAYYYVRVATPLYATNTEFVIQKADGASAAGGGLGGLLGGGGFATQQESITVQAYLESREAMLRLEEELGFRAHFSGEEIDPLTRIPADATMEDVYDTYRRHLRIGYDPTEGLIRMEVAAADPETSQAFSQALISYAEERVDQMSQRLRADQMDGARDSFEEAETRVLEAQERVIDLQEQRGVLSTEAEVSTVFEQIANFELQLQEERLRLDELLSVARPNEARVDLAERNVVRLEVLIDDLRAGLTDTGGEEVSLARVQSELVIAQADLETRQMLLAQALQQMEMARIEANRQSLYLLVGVFPVAPDAPAYPRAFENTALALLVFTGIYLMISMTVSILREQVTS